MYPNIAGINYESIVDGPGIRTAIFLSGCQHHCNGCHNEFAQNPMYGAQVSPALVAQNILTREYIAGITLTGGDPLFWPENTWNFLKDLTDILKRYQWFDRRKSAIWCYTGYIYEQLPDDQNIRAILNMTDVLVDGPFIQSVADKRLVFRGSANQRLIDIAKTKAANSIVIWNNTEEVI